MEFEDLIDLVRDSYLGQFSEFIDQQVKTAEAEGAKKGTGEVKLQLPEDSGLYRNYYCADFMGADDASNIVELSPDEEVTFDAVDVTLGQMEMRVERLQWNDLNIALDGPLDGRDLAEWFEQWFDPEDAVFDPDTRFSGNIHSLTIDGESLAVDLGTAPSDALVDLLATLEALGYKHIRMS